MCAMGYMLGITKDWKMAQKSIKRRLIKNYGKPCEETALPECPSDLTLSTWARQPKPCPTADLSLDRTPCHLPETQEDGGLQLAAPRPSPPASWPHATLS